MIFESPYPPVEETPATLASFVLHRAEQLGTRPAIIDGLSGQALGYDELATAVRNTAAGLKVRGLRKGDVVAFFSPNTPLFPVVLLGTALAGGVLTTANPLYTARELGTQLKDSGARFLITTEGLMETVRDALHKSPVDEVFLLDHGSGSGRGKGPRVSPFGELALCGAPFEPPALDWATDAVVLPYSSGTTGLPKGVVLTHRNLVMNIRQQEGCTGHVLMCGDDTILTVLPQFHIYGIFELTCCALRAGATIVVLPRFELESYLETIARYGVTFLHVVPPIALMLAQRPEVAAHDLSRVRAVFSAAAPLSAAQSNALGDRLGCPVIQAYGQTETSPLSIRSPATQRGEQAGAAGVVVPNTQVRVVDMESGTLLGPNQPGEIQVRGPQVMREYLGQPEATADTIDPEGWLRSGDIGYADGDGYFYVIDRVKELIKYNGYQVPPAELESILLTHPDVADAAVVAAPDAEAGEIPVAFVVSAPGATANADALMEFVAGQVAPFKKVRKVVFAPSIPKSPSGKILRRVLRDELVGG